MTSTSGQSDGNFNQPSSPGASSSASPLPSLSSEAQTLLHSFWNRVTDDIRKLGVNDFKQQELPLARIKKIMKLDEDVKMISAEAPVLFAKAAEIFVTELTLRAWVHTEDNKRRTLQRNDIAMAITKFDQFDFLIDIVPRDEIKLPPAKRTEQEAVGGGRAPSVGATGTGAGTALLSDQVQYYFQLAQQHQAALQQPGGHVQAGQAQIQFLQTGGQIQTLNASPAIQTIPAPVHVQTTQTTDSQSSQQHQQTHHIPVQVQPTVQANPTATPSVNAQPQLVQVTSAQQQAQQAAAAAGGGGGIQIIQQVLTNTGEIQQIPIQLTAAQVELIRMQMQGQATNQPIIIQTNPIQTTAATQQQAPQTVYQIQQVAANPQGQGPTPVFLTTAAQGQQTLQLQQVATQEQGNGTDEQQQ